MRILFCSYTFAPDVGGIETVGQLLAAEFQARGHTVRVLTQSTGSSAGSLPVTRRPGWFQILREVRQADIVFHNNISLRFAWPFLLVRKPWVVAHHTWIQRPNGRIAVQDRIKRRTLRTATNIAISRSVSAHLPVDSKVIPDPYDAATFHVSSQAKRNRDLMFVGRLVSDKGADDLLQALTLLKTENLKPSLTVAGDGPERRRLQARAQELGIDAVFHGSQPPVELARHLNEHRILVVPSRWNEPFGVVALEGIACGCAVIGTSGGGLPQAIGPCGAVVPNGNIPELARAIKDFVTHPAKVDSIRNGAEAHLKRFHPSTVADQYLDVFEEALPEVRP